jgi:damage-control phosphatase, subfamily I
VRTYLDCYPCFLHQVIESARVAALDEHQQRSALQQTLAEAQTFDSTYPPSEMSSRIQALVRQASRNGDPYRQVKDTCTRQALAMYPHLKQLVQQSADPLETAVRLSVAGNIIDLGVLQTYDLESTVQRVLSQPFAINDLPALRQALAQCGRVLFLGDNAGETVFDRLLIETLSVPVTYVVKCGPTVNDATREDALAAGLHHVAEIVDNGADALGTLLYRCSPGFLRRFQEADLILAKGQANYESLDGSGAPVFFLLQAKCTVIAGHLGVPQYGIVLKREPADAARNATAPAVACES